MQRFSRCFSSKVNALYRPGVPATAAKPRTPVTALNTDDVTAVLAKHNDDAHWSPEQLKASANSHTLMTWGATAPMLAGALQPVRSDGMYFWDADGKKYLDFNSQAMCLHHGHTPDPRIVEAITTQLETLPYMYPGMAVPAVRARLCELLSEVFPGDLNTFMFPSSGAEANECAVRMAKLYTGRNKIMARYRSYHGGTNATLQLTGDFRRFPAEPGMPGVVHFFDPWPYSFSKGATEAEVCEMSLKMLREQIHCEGTNQVAAIIMESVTGTNGLLAPPAGYLEGVREMCDEFGIVMILDEVMAGFGRTGKMFGFQIADSVVPDITTFAKGVNGAFLPMGGVGIRDHLAEHFRTNLVGYGSTYNGHPVVLAGAYEAIKVHLEKNLVGNAADMGVLMQAGLEELAHKHKSIKQARGLGLFWAFDVQKNTAGDFIGPVDGPLHPAMAAFKAALLQSGMFTMMRGHTVFLNPPLIINAEQVEEGMKILDECLHVLDEVVEE